MFLGGNPRIPTFSGDKFLDGLSKESRSILNIAEESYPVDLTQPFELSSEGEKQVFPQPGFCIKSKTNDDRKVFINMCHCEDVPRPAENLMSLTDGGDDDPIRFPVGLGLPREEKDKSGNNCICFDVVINTEFLHTLLKDEDKRSFVMSICIQGISDKYGIFVREDCCIKLTKPYHGTVQRHFVKNTDSFDLTNPLSFPKGNLNQSKLIKLMESSPLEDKAASGESSVRSKNSGSKNKCSIQSKDFDKSAKNQNPLSVLSKLPKEQKLDFKYGLFQVPASNCYPLQYVLEVYMHGLNDKAHTQLKVFASTNRIVITEEMHSYNVDVNLPNPVIPERSQANFHDGILAVVLPLAHIKPDED